MSSELELSLPAVPASVRRMRNAAAEFAAASGLPAHTVRDVRLAVSEAVTNSVRYGSPLGADIVLSLAAAPSGLTISVRDAGIDAARSPAPGLGLGLPIMSAVADAVTFDQVAGGTMVTMTFRAPASP